MLERVAGALHYLSRNGDRKGLGHTYACAVGCHVMKIVSQFAEMGVTATLEEVAVCNLILLSTFDFLLFAFITKLDLIKKSVVNPPSLKALNSVESFSL